MERLDTENLNQNDSNIGLLSTPRFTHAAEEQAVPVEKLPPAEGGRKGLLGTRISSIRFLATGVLATLVLGVIGGVLTGLGDSREPATFSSVAESANGDIGSGLPKQLAASEATINAGDDETAHASPAARRRALHVIRQRAASSSAELTQTEEPSQRPVARKVGVITASSYVEFRRKKKSEQSDN